MMLKITINFHNSFYGTVFQEDQNMEIIIRVPQLPVPGQHNEAPEKRAFNFNNIWEQCDDVNVTLTLRL